MFPDVASALDHQSERRVLRNAQSVSDRILVRRRTCNGVHALCCISLHFVCTPADLVFFLSLVILCENLYVQFFNGFIGTRGKQMFTVWFLDRNMDTCRLCYGKERG